MERGAEISGCGKYRYMLWRSWGATLSHPMVTFVMLNPSTADAEKDDPTILRCIGFARDWGYSGVMVVNVMAYRATKPRDIPLDSMEEAIGPDNSIWMDRTLRNSELIIPAWGSYRKPFTHAYAVTLSMINRISTERPGIPVEALVINKDGSPKHPLYVPSDAERVKFPIY